MLWVPYFYIIFKDHFLHEISSSGIKGLRVQLGQNNKRGIGRRSNFLYSEREPEGLPHLDLSVPRGDNSSGKWLRDCVP